MHRRNVDLGSGRTHVVAGDLTLVEGSLGRMVTGS